MSADILAALTAACNKHFQTDCLISDLKCLTGGASAETWKFDCSVKGEALPCILRRSAVQASGQFGVALTKRQEAETIQAVNQYTIPAPKVHFILQDSDGLGEGYIMQRMEGETIPRKILRDEVFAPARENLTEQCAKALAQLHAISVAEIPALPDLAPEKQIPQLEGLYRAFNQPSAVFELSFRWLQANAPKHSRNTLVHGDFRTGNLLVNPQGLVGILDWELSHLGDPMEDLGWLCVNSWRFGSPLPVGGFGSRDAFYAAYEKYSGVAVNPADVHFWEVFGTLKWGVICLFQVFTHLNGLKRSVELAAIGRRVSETEYDLLNLLEAPPCR
ncbi:MAG TPA: phosphotransferase family protein [Pseudomonadales bacterium]|nr:phosphotransferase family protein [Pseudomonadales bacterium]